MADRVYVNGELYLTLEAVAEIYQVQTVWLHKVCDAGLLSPRRTTEAGRCIAVVHLDRVATIVRLHVGLGLDIDMIAVTLEQFAPPRP